jgi:hypothetical protein
MAPSLPCGSRLSVYDFVPDNYESLKDRGGGAGQQKTSGQARPVGDKLVANKGEEAEVGAEASVSRGSNICSANWQRGAETSL